MEKYITKNSIKYELRGEQYYPVVDLPVQKDIGKWGSMHLGWIKRHHIARYTELLMSGELNECLYQVNEEALERFDFLVADLAGKYELTEELKARDQMKWVGLASYIAKIAKEIVESEVIFV